MIASAKAILLLVTCAMQLLAQSGIPDPAEWELRLNGILKTPNRESSLQRYLLDLAPVWDTARRLDRVGPVRGQFALLAARTNFWLKQPVTVRSIALEEARFVAGRVEAMETRPLRRLLELYVEANEGGVVSQIRYDAVIVAGLLEGARRLVVSNFWDEALTLTWSIGRMKPTRAERAMAASIEGEGWLRRGDLDRAAQALTIGAARCGFSSSIAPYFYDDLISCDDQRLREARLQLRLGNPGAARDILRFRKWEHPFRAHAATVLTAAADRQLGNWASVVKKCGDMLAYLRIEGDRARGSLTPDAIEEARVAWRRAVPYVSEALSFLAEASAFEPRAGEILRAWVDYRPVTQIDSLWELRSSAKGEEWSKLAALQRTRARLSLAGGQPSLRPEFEELAACTVNAPVGVSIEETALYCLLTKEQRIEYSALARGRPTRASNLESLSTAEPHSDFVIFQQASRIDFSRNADPSPQYIGVAVREGQPVRILAPVPALIVDPLVRRLHTELSGQLTTWRESSASLYRILLAPLGLSGNGALVLSPDGLLHLAPFAALAMADGQLLIERREVRFMNHLQDPGSRANLSSGESVLIHVSNFAAIGQEDRRIHVQPLPREFPLDGVAREVAAVRAHLPSPVTVLDDTRATEQRILGIRRPRLLHLATHGRYLDSSVRLASFSLGRRRSILVREIDPGDQARGAFLRSYLALKGINGIRPRDDDDGVLTALEIQSMDLEGTRLVILSACQTARGAVLTGEGVFGLRRAFHIAGARAVLSTIWSADDETSVRFMSAFYAKLASGRTASAALRATQVEFLRAGGETRDRHPGSWALYTLSGLDVSLR